MLSEYTRMALRSRTKVRHDRRDSDASGEATKNHRGKSNQGVRSSERLSLCHFSRRSARNQSQLQVSFANPYGSTAPPNHVSSKGVAPVTTIDTVGNGFHILSQLTDSQLSYVSGDSLSPNSSDYLGADGLQIMKNVDVGNIRTGTQEGHVSSLRSSGKLPDSVLAETPNRRQPDEVRLVKNLVTPSWKNRRFLPRVRTLSSQTTSCNVTRSLSFGQAQLRQDSMSASSVGSTSCPRANEGCKEGMSSEDRIKNLIANEFNEKLKLHMSLVDDEIRARIKQLECMISLEHAKRMEELEQKHSMIQQLGTRRNDYRKVVKDLDEKHERLLELKKTALHDHQKCVEMLDKKHHEIQLLNQTAIDEHQKRIEELEVHVSIINDKTENAVSILDTTMLTLSNATALTHEIPTLVNQAVDNALTTLVDKVLPHLVNPVKRMARGIFRGLMPLTRSRDAESLVSSPKRNQLVTSFCSDIPIKIEDSELSSENRRLHSNAAMVVEYKTRKGRTVKESSALRRVRTEDGVQYNQSYRNCRRHTPDQSHFVPPEKNHKMREPVRSSVPLKKHRMEEASCVTPIRKRRPFRNPDVGNAVPQVSNMSDSALSTKSMSSAPVLHRRSKRPRTFSSHQCYSNDDYAFLSK